MTTDKSLLRASQSCATAAANIKRVSGMFKDKPATADHIFISVEMRDTLCDLLDTVANMLHELSIAAGLDAEDLGTKP